MPKIKQLSFEGQTIFCGIDVHKKTWRVNIRNEDFELEDYSQDPCEKLLMNRLRKGYPGATYQVAYEAGYSGFSIERSLKKAGINCIIINPADVPTSDKDKKRKSDMIDARKISRELSNGTLQGIYVPTREMEQARTLVRLRDRLVSDQTRCKNRIWHMLMFSGLKLDVDKPKHYWSCRFIETLRQIPCEYQSLKCSLDIAVEEYLQVRKLLSQTTKQVRALAEQESLLEYKNYFEAFQV